VTTFSILQKLLDGINLAMSSNEQAVIPILMPHQINCLV
jgi:hypothetical protein